MIDPFVISTFKEQEDQTAGGLRGGKEDKSQRGAEVSSKELPSCTLGVEGTPKGQFTELGLAELGDLLPFSLYMYAHCANSVRDTTKKKGPERQVSESVTSKMSKTLRIFRRSRVQEFSIRNVY